MPQSVLRIQLVKENYDMYKKLGAITLLIIGLVLNHKAQANAKTSRSPRPNILWIMLEDWGTDLSCYGTQAVHTPHIDQ